jgi:6-phosphofructokinase 1
MLRLNKADFEDPHEIAKFAATCGIPMEEFRKQFYYIIENDRLYNNVKEGRAKIAPTESNLVHNFKNKKAEIPGNDIEITK